MKDRQNLINDALLQIAAGVKKFNSEQNNYKAYAPDSIEFNEDGELHLKFTIYLDKYIDYTQVRFGKDRD